MKPEHLEAARRLIARFKDPRAILDGISYPMVPVGFEDALATLIAEREAAAAERLRSLLAGVREVLRFVDASAPEIHGDGRKPERSWGASLSMAPIVGMLAKLDAELAAGEKP